MFYTIVVMYRNAPSKVHKENGVEFFTKDKLHAQTLLAQLAYAMPKADLNLVEMKVIA